MTALASLLFIAMIPIDCKITNFSLYLLLCLYHTGAYAISHSFLQMLNLEWTLCTGLCTIEELRNRGMYMCMYCMQIKGWS